MTLIAIAAGSRRPRWALEVGLVVAFYVAYDSVRGLINGRAPSAVHHAIGVLHLERIFAIAWEHPANAAMTHAAFLAVPACYFYASAHFIVTPSVLIWMFRRHHERYRSARTALALICTAALLGFWLYPTAPPRLLAGYGFRDTMSVYRHWGWWGTSDSAPTALAGLANQFAAMPSLHMAWSLWCGLIVYRHARRPTVRIVALAYPVITAIVIVGTANHFMLDVLAGIAICLIADRGVRFMACRALSACATTEAVRSKHS